MPQDRTAGETNEGAELRSSFAMELHRAVSVGIASLQFREVPENVPVDVPGCANAAWVALRRGRATGVAADTDMNGSVTRSRFLALAGIFSSGYFFLVIAAEGLANLVIDPGLAATMPIQQSAEAARMRTTRRRM